MLLPIWLSIREKSEQAKADYDKKVLQTEQEKLQQENKQTSLGKERYQKDFFNKLDEGENLIVLYQQEEEKVVLDQEQRKMYWWQEIEQNFLVWWRNLELKKELKK